MFAQILFPVLVLLRLLPQTTDPAAAPQIPASPSAYRVSGRVIDAISGQPLARALVVLNPSGTPTDSARVYVADNGGNFAFANVLPGKYNLFARHRGYIQQMFQQHEAFTTAIIVGPGLESENLIFSLRPETSISGEVLDETNDLVRHADVTLFLQTFAMGKRRTIQMRRAATDDEGHYHFGHLVPGIYFVCVSIQPWYAEHNLRFRPKQDSQDDEASGGEQSLDVVYQVTFYPNATDLAGATPIPLRSGDKSIADFRMRPVPALHLLLRTTAPDNGQSTNVQVIQNLTLNSTVGIAANSTPVGPGLLELTGVPPGNFYLRLNTSVGDESTRRSQIVQLSGDMELDAGRGGSIIVGGVVRMEDASPLPQPVRLRLRNSSSGEGFDVTVPASGEFSFKNYLVDTGDYELFILEPQGLFIKYMASSGAKVSGRSFQIATAEDVSVTITASKGTGMISGIALKNDKPSSGVMIVLAPQDLRSNPALFRRDQSDSDGTFSMNTVVPGQYTVVAIEDGWDLEWADPDVLQKYIARGEKVQIAPNGKAEVKVKVN